MKKILIIDDEELIIRTLANVLQSRGYDTFLAKNPADALVLADEEQFDLIISDICLPGTDGVQTVSEIIANLKARKLPPPPIIFISGYAAHALLQKAALLKPLACMDKPFELVDMLQKVQAALT